MTVKEAKALHKQYTKLKNDRERLQFFIEHKDKLFISLDNDSSLGSFKDEKLQERMDLDYFCFDHYFGNTEGVFLLFEFLGIETEGV